MNSNILSLFPVPVYSSVIKEDYSPIVEKISKIKYQEMKLGGGKISESKQVLDSLDYLKPLKDKIQNHIDNFTKTILSVDDCDFYVKSSWIVRLEKGNYSQSHIHGNSMISGVLYLQTDNLSSLINFNKDPKYNNLFSNTLVPKFKEFNQFNSDFWAGATTTGQLYLFPSNLSHSVTEQMSQQTRYSLAFDCFVRGSFGHKDEAELIIK